MLAHEISEIEQRAQETLETTFSDVISLEPPINLDAIVKQYGLLLKQGEFADDSISGVFDRAEMTIYLNEQEGIQRKVFTTAHELGHFILHESNEGEILFRTDGFTMNEALKPEQEANIFAASLLMPGELIRVYWHLTRNAAQMANIFGVSLIAMKYRLKNLHLK